MVKKHGFISILIETLLVVLGKPLGSAGANDSVQGQLLSQWLQDQFGLSTVFTGQSELVSHWVIPSAFIKHGWLGNP